MVGGYPIPEVNRLMHAFMNGAKEVNPDTEFLVTFIGSWYDPPKAKEAAFAMIDAGADIMYAERYGVSDAAAEREVLAIGNVIDTQEEYPGTVVASALWHMEPTIDLALEKVTAGEFAAEDYGTSSNLGVGGCSIAPMNPDLVAAELIADIEAKPGSHCGRLAGCRDQRRRTQFNQVTSEERPAAGVTALRLSGITKRFGDFTANNRIDLELQSGEILALLGENGAGKTTLMNILFGHYVPDAGTIELAARSGRLRPLAHGSPHAALAAGVGMVHQHFTLADNLSALDNILLGTEPLFSLRQKRNEARSKLKGLMRSTGLEVELDAPIARLSVGERQRVELLKALYRDIRILILDEPTAVLTPQQSQALFSTLKHLANQGLAIIFISHKLDEVLALSDRIAVLRHGEKVVDRSATGISKAELAQTMVDREIKPPASRPSEPGEIVIELREVIVAPGSNQEPIDAITMQMRRGEILGIAGVSGNGQRAFANLLSSTLTPDRGEMYLYGDPWPKDAARGDCRRDCPHPGRPAS